MTTPILVTGGTGTLRRPVARRLRDAGAVDRAFFGYFGMKLATEAHRPAA